MCTNATFTEGILSYDTIQRVMGGIAPEYMQSVYKKWNVLVNSNEGETLKKLFALTEKMEEKLNEVTAILHLLNTIQVKGCVTIDAMEPQMEIVEKIKQKQEVIMAMKRPLKSPFPNRNKRIPPM